MWGSQSQALLTFQSCSMPLSAHPSPLSWETCSKVSSWLGLSLLVPPVPRGQAHSFTSGSVMQKSTLLAWVDWTNRAKCQAKSIPHSKACHELHRGLLSSSFVKPNPDPGVLWLIWDLKARRSQFKAPGLSPWCSPLILFFFFFKYFSLNLVSD